MNRYTVAYISGDSSSIAYVLKETIENINDKNGEIKEIVQSQSTSQGGKTIVTITIIYSIPFPSFV